MKKIIILFLCGAWLSSFSQTSVTINANVIIVTPSDQVEEPNDSIAGRFHIVLEEASTTSCGIYYNDTLKATLWNNVRFEAGTHTFQWNGKNELGQTLNPSLSYTRKVVINNVEYEWQGVVGNTSDQKTGNTIYRGYGIPIGMAIAEGNGYFAIGYGEGAPSRIKISTSTPNTVTKYIDNTTGTATSFFAHHVVTDGVRVYWSMTAPYSVNDNSTNWITATNVSDDLDHTFSSGSSFTPLQVDATSAFAGTYASVINKFSNVIGSYTTGLAVQKTGNYLFSSTKDQDIIRVFHKITGAPVDSFSIESPEEIVVDPSENYLWIISEGVVRKHAITGSSISGTASVTLSGVTNPLAINTNGVNISLVDGYPSYQVKTFTPSGTLVWSFGQVGGYSTDATVENDKFYFTRTFIAYDNSDSSFWVSDDENFRVQHFTKSRSYIEQVAHLAVLYTVSSNLTDSSQIFANGLQFKVNYDEELSGSSGWELDKNWKSNIDPNYLNIYGVLRNVITMPNGKTYALTDYPDAHLSNLYELTEGGVARLANEDINYRAWMDASGSLYFSTTAQNSPYFSYKKEFLGFDEDNNFIWGEDELLENFSFSDTIGIGYNERTNNITSTGISIHYDPEPTGHTEHKYHAVGTKNGKVIFKTELSTHYNYRGIFPTNGMFDIGNLVNANAGSHAWVIDRNLFFGYHGEFWKMSQNNRYNHFLDNGLMIGQFGADGPVMSISPAGMAGNALYFSIIKVGSDLYVITSDESYHAGIQLWKISNLGSIIEQEFDIIAPVPVIDDSTTLYTGLTKLSTVVNNIAGWHRTPTTDNAETNLYNTPWAVRTNYISTSKTKVEDVWSRYDNSTGNANIYRDLPISIVDQNWTLTGNLMVNKLSNYTLAEGGFFFEILDDEDKVITSLSWGTAFGLDQWHIFFNDETITSTDDDYILELLMKQPNKFTITRVGTTLSCKFGDYTLVSTTNTSEVGADVVHPSKVRLNFKYQTGLFGEAAIKNLRFN